MKSSTIGRKLIENKGKNPLENIVWNKINDSGKGCVHHHLETNIYYLNFLQSPNINLTIILIAHINTVFEKKTSTVYLTGNASDRLFSIKLI